MGRIPRRRMYYMAGAQSKQRPALRRGRRWVGTLPEQRGRGYGEAVTWAAIQEGFRRGASFANLQASPMGRPISERMGFETITAYRVLVGPV